MRTLNLINFCIPPNLNLVLTLSLLVKLLVNSIFEAPVIRRTLNINNLRTTSAKSINLHTIRKAIEYTLKNVLVWTIFTLTIFKILLFEGRSALPTNKRGTASERVKKKLYVIYIKWNLFEKWRVANFYR